MRIRWSPEAADDLAGIVSYIKEHSPSRAPLVASKILEQLELLAQFPGLGRVGRKPGTREIVLVGLSYLAVYQLSEGVAEIVRVLHGAQDWAPRSSSFQTGPSPAGSS